MRLKTTILFVSVSWVLAACNGTVTDFVKSAQPGNIGSTPSLPLQANGPMALKVSPGQLKGAASDVSAQGHITPTNRKFNAGDMSAQVTMSRVRVSP